MIRQAIDKMLGSLAGRDLFSHDEVQDMLLDLRGLTDDKEITDDDIQSACRETEVV